MKEDIATSETIPVGGRFYRALDWFAFGLASLVSFAIYCYTLAPTVTLEDSGELAVASDYMGVPHPPGYPVWSFLSWIFTKIFIFVKFRGQPNPAWSVGLMSAFFGALTCGITAMLICRSGSDILRELRQNQGKENARGQDYMCFVGGVVASILFALSPVMWSQAVIVEIYTLNAFFLVLIFLMTYQWMCRPTDRLLYVTAFIFGLGLAHYYVILLAALPLVVAVFLADLKLFRDFMIAGIPFAGIYWLIGQGYLPPIAHPTHVTAIVYITLNCLLLVLVYFFLPKGKTVALTILLAEVGVAAYVYMPLSSDLRNPPINWGYPRTFEGFMHAITRGQYEKIVPTNVFSVTFLHQIGDYFSDLRVQFTLLSAPLGFLVFTAWKVGSRRFSALSAAIWLCLLAVFIALAEKVLLPGEQHLMIIAFKLIFAVVLILMASGVTAVGITQFREMRLKLTGKTQALGWEMAGVVVVLLMAFLAALVAKALLVPNLPGNVAVRYKTLQAFIRLLAVAGAATVFAAQMVTPGARKDDQKRSLLIDRVLWGFVSLVILAAYGGYLYNLGGTLIDIRAALRAPGLTVAQARDIDFQTVMVVVMIILPVVAVTAVSWLMRNMELTILVGHKPQRWLIATMMGFLVMSLAMIALASPKGDIQDNFIQKVKFISSHALYAFWVGYGLIFGLAFSDELFKRNALVRRLSLGVALMLPLVQLYQNWYDKELQKIYGGAEQNMHDFGWQFGNFQLRGAAAIREELEPDEEPLPNPQYPPPMTQDAIFYGGTDPGRFVPTYMIYSARVREDVYLITQNALADNTYMSVMRDLYGDRIWIPAQPDSAMAFHRYVEEVRAGKRPPNAELKIEGGRVQVSGALGVMEINGILAQMIFEHNNYRHDFYVEESYVIPWMYPYLTPHGLIMKINRAPGEVPAENIRDDLDFWDWYTRRLTANVRFRRDIVGMKSFSKLRSAIGGLYASPSRQKFAEAERAFQEARLLYPLSPEANFRLVQEVLMPFRRFNEARAIMKEFAEQDPNNSRAADFVKHLEGIIALQVDIKKMQDELSKSPQVDVQKALNLADLYRRANMIPEFLQLTGNVMQNTNMPWQIYYRVAGLLRDAGRHGEMSQTLDFLMPRVPVAPPETSQVLLEIIKMYGTARRPDRMAQVLDIYLQRNPKDWRAWLDSALVRLGMNQPNEAGKAVEQAVDIGGLQALDIVTQDTRFAPVRDKVMKRAQQLMSLPGLMPDALRKP